MKEIILNPEKTRKKIVEASLKLFAEHGYKGASLSEICKMANLTKGALYWHFKSKKELYFEVIKEVSLRIEFDFNTIFRSDAKAIDKLQNLFAKFAELCTNSLDVTYMYNIQVKDYSFIKEDQAGQSLFEWWDVVALQNLFDQAIADGDINGNLSAKKIYYCI
jgi:AcrR family transcriptional regulator